MSVVSELDDHVRRKIVESSLTDFFHKYDPRHVSTVEAKCQEHSKNLEGYLAGLLKRYPRAPPDTFDVVLSTLRGLDNAITTQRVAKESQATMRSKHAQVQELLRDGAALLAVSTPSTKFHGDNTVRDDDSQSHHSGTSQSFYTGSFWGGGGETVIEDEDDQATSQGHQEDLTVLRQLIDDNRRLAREVAIAEQHVLQKRFEVAFIKHGVPRADAPREDRETAMTMTITDEDRTFQLPCTSGEMAFIQRGPLEAPWSLDESEHCTVSFQPSEGQRRFPILSSPKRDGSMGGTEPAKVIRTVLAMAMRVWARRSPHSVIERFSNGDATTHTSSILWWQWPTICEGHRGVVPESLLDESFAIGAGVGRIGGVVQSNHPKGQGTAALHDEVCRLLATTPNTGPSSVAEPNELQSSPSKDAFWRYFLQQHRALSHNIQSTGDALS